MTNADDRGQLTRDWVDPLGFGNDVVLDRDSLDSRSREPVTMKPWLDEAGEPLRRRDGNPAAAPLWGAQNYSFSDQGSNLGSSYDSLGGFSEKHSEEFHSFFGAEWDEPINGPADSFFTCDATVTSWRCTKKDVYFYAPVRTVCQAGCLVCLADSLRHHGTKTVADDAHSLKLWSSERNWPLRADQMCKGIVVELVCPECRRGWNTTVEWLRQNQSGCPRCAYGKSDSKPERWLFRSLQKLYGERNVERNVPIAGFKGGLDIAIGTPSGAKIAIEYDGWWYHKGSDKVESDTRKTDLTLDGGYAAFIRVRERPGNGGPPLPNIRRARNIQPSTASWDPGVLCEIANIIHEYDNKARTVSIEEAADARTRTKLDPKPGD